jgi:hypothetical protein
LLCTRRGCNIERVKLTYVLSALLVLGATACEKASDTGKLEDEVRTAVARDQPAVAHLASRAKADDAVLSGTADAADKATATTALAAANRAIGEAQSIAAGVTRAVQEASAKGPQDLHNLYDEATEKTERDIRIANADLTSVEYYAWHHANTAPAKRLTLDMLSEPDDPTTTIAVPVTP